MSDAVTELSASISHAAAAKIGSNFAKSATLKFNVLNALKARGRRFSSQSRSLYVAEYQPGFYAALVVGRLGPLEDGAACVDPDYPCRREWLVPADAEECSEGEISVVWDPLSILACAGGHCYFSSVGLGNDFGPEGEVLRRAERLRPDLVRRLGELDGFGAEVYMPSVRAEDCRGRVLELCNVHCEAAMHLHCGAAELDAYVDGGGNITACVRCEGACPSLCESAAISAVSLARDYVAASARPVAGRALYDRSTIAAVVAGFGALALTADGEKVVGTAEDVARWLSDRGRGHIAELILREEAVGHSG